MLTSGATAGTAHVTASLDAAQAIAAVEIVAPPVGTAPPVVSGDAVVGERAVVLARGVDRRRPDLCAPVAARRRRHSRRDGCHVHDRRRRCRARGGLPGDGDQRGRCERQRRPATRSRSCAPPVSTAPPVRLGRRGRRERAVVRVRAVDGPAISPTSRQWLRDGVDIPGETGATYTARRRRRARGELRDTATNTVGASVSADSNDDHGSACAAGQHRAPVVSGDCGRRERAVVLVRAVDRRLADRTRASGCATASTFPARPARRSRA